MGQLGLTQAEKEEEEEEEETKREREREKGWREIVLLFIRCPVLPRMSDTVRYDTVWRDDT